MATRDKSFTINIIPHDANRRRREWIVTGRKVILFRILLAAIVVSVAASVFVLTLGAGELSRNTELQERNTILADSLAQARELNHRLDEIEQELQEIRETRDVIENLATAGVPEE